MSPHYFCVTNTTVAKLEFHLFGTLFSFNAFMETYCWKNFVFHSLLLPLTKFLNFLHVKPKLHTSTKDNTSLSRIYSKISFGRYDTNTLAAITWNTDHLVYLKRLNHSVIYDQFWSVDLNHRPNLMDQSSKPLFRQLRSQIHTVDVLITDYIQEHASVTYQYLWFSAKTRSKPVLLTVL